MVPVRRSRKVWVVWLLQRLRPVMLVLMKVRVVVEISSSLPGPWLGEGGGGVGLDEDLGGMMGVIVGMESLAGYFSLRLGGYIPGEGVPEK
jgi:hypothetical protein